MRGMKPEYLVGTTVYQSLEAAVQRANADAAGRVGPLRIPIWKLVGLVIVDPPTYATSRFVEVE